MEAAAAKEEQEEEAEQVRRASTLASRKYKSINFPAKRSDSPELTELKAPKTKAENHRMWRKFNGHKLAS